MINGIIWYLIWTASWTVAVGVAVGIVSQNRKRRGHGAEPWTVPKE